VLEHIKFLRSVGQFDSVSTGTRLPLSKFTLLYAGNGRGKTTLSAIFRSLGNGDPISVVERHRLAATNPPQVTLTLTGAVDAVFMNGAWSRQVPEIAVFDDLFVSENVCSGVDVDTEHRQKLHELILGAQGVALNNAVQQHVERVEEHNKDLRAKEAAIPASFRGNLTVDAFCALPEIPNIALEIEQAERDLSAARSADAIRTQGNFRSITLPSFDIEAIDALLSRDLPSLNREAAAKVQAQLAKLGGGSERWVSEGMARIEPASAGLPEKVCPFCTQPLSGSDLIALYVEYFGEAYEGLKRSIDGALAELRETHTGEVTAAFERAIRVAVQQQKFWSEFMQVAEIDLDTAEVARARKAASDAVIAAIRSKQGAPLEESHLSTAAKESIEKYHLLRLQVEALNSSFTASNAEIAIIKERAAAANTANLVAHRDRLLATRTRYDAAVAPLCTAYLQAKEAKKVTEKLRDDARDQLDTYRKDVFPKYQIAINDYLRRFNAGFSLEKVDSVNTRAGSSCTYHIVINNVEVPVSAATAGGPCFKNTLSAGDRNTLALAFFFSSLEQGPGLANRIVVVDDPMTSLDEHRSLTTIQEMRRLTNVVAQVIVLSHSKPFLCHLWEGADKDTRTAIRITRDGAGSTLTAWDVEQDSITEHDKRHALVLSYLETSNPADERAVASALRPILEQFTRVAYPDHFPPGSLLGPFIGECRDKAGTPRQILAIADVDELRDLLDYGNKFHHDTNRAYETETINDSELTHFAQRVIQFTRHR
jgi:wobble nucleotide-excising tRNase